MLGTNAYLFMYMFQGVCELTPVFTLVVTYFIPLHTSWMFLEITEPGDIVWCQQQPKPTYKSLKWK